MFPNTYLRVSQPINLYMDTYIDGLFICSFIYSFVVYYSPLSKTFLSLSAYERKQWNNLLTCACFQVLFLMNCVYNIVEYENGNPNAISLTTRNLDYLSAFFVFDSLYLMYYFSFSDYFIFVVHHVVGIILTAICKGCATDALLFTNALMLCAEFTNPWLNTRKIVMWMYGSQSRQYATAKYIARNIFVTCRLRMFAVILPLYIAVVSRIYASVWPTLCFSVLSYSLYGVSWTWYKGEKAKNLL
jgi:hypothetical protein